MTASCFPVFIQFNASQNLWCTGWFQSRCKLRSGGSLRVHTPVERSCSTHFAAWYVGVVIELAIVKQDHLSGLNCSLYQLLHPLGTMTITSSQGRLAHCWLEISIHGCPYYYLGEARLNERVESKVSVRFALPVGNRHDQVIGTLRETAAFLCGHELVLQATCFVIAI